jgi:hypothetical protein
VDGSQIYNFESVMHTFCIGLNCTYLKWGKLSVQQHTQGLCACNHLQTEKAKSFHVSNIKNHAVDVHGGSTIIDHIKMSRDNMDEVSETMYFDSQLWYWLSNWRKNEEKNNLLSVLVYGEIPR